VLDVCVGVGSGESALLEVEALGGATAMVLAGESPTAAADTTGVAIFSFFVSSTRVTAGATPPPFSTGMGVPFACCVRGVEVGVGLEAPEAAAEVFFLSNNGKGMTGTTGLASILLPPLLWGAAAEALRPLAAGPLAGGAMVDAAGGRR
jgi:hypothetical protein